VNDKIHNHATIFCIKYETNGIFEAIFENHKQLERFFYKFYELEIYPGALSKNWQFLSVSVG